MHTNDERERNLLNSLIHNSFEIDFISIKLVSDTEEYHGKGILYMKKDGQFYLKFFNNQFLDNNETVRKLFVERDSKIPIFSMYGVDYNGRNYFCSYLFCGQQILNVSEFELSGKIEMDFSRSLYSKIIFYGEYKLPQDKLSNSKTNLGEYLWYTDNQHVWEIELDEGLIVVFSQFDGYAEAIFVGESNENVDAELLNKVISTFDFMTGKETEPILINLGKKNQCFYGKRNMLLANSTFASPLPMNHNRGSDFTINHTSLFKSYFNFIGKDEGKILPDIHKRIVSSSRGYIFAMGLVVSIQIENICKQFFVDRYIKDDDYCNQAIEAIRVLRELNKEQFNGVIEKLKGSIPSGSRSSVNVKNILKNLCEEGLVNNQLVKSWIRMRNNTAHGENVSGDGWNKFLDEAFLCINLYYVLIFHVIGYKGYIRYYEDCHNSKLINLLDKDK